MEISDGTPNKSSSFPPPPQVPEGDQGRRSLPKEYKKTLMKHMRAEEDGEMSAIEMKKLNEERQKILKTRFESPSKQNSPRGEGSRRKKKNRKKNKKVGQNNNIVSIEKDVGVNDEDETRVLEPYESSSGEDCMIMDVEEPSLPVYIQPSSPRAVNNYPQTQRQPIGPQPSPPRQANNYPPTQRQPLGPADNYARNHFPVNPPQRQEPPSGPRELRYIVIDGSNVAMHHGRGKIFSCKGIQLCVDYFLKRGHTKITCFVPAWRRYKPRHQNPISDQEILVELNERGLLEFTPARRLDNKLISSYDDRYVVELAETVEGIIVSNDQYRDLMGEKYSWKKIIEERLLQYNFVGDILMIPDDPLGQHGPKLDLFLSKPSRQPSPLRKRHLSPKGATGHQNMWNQPPPPLQQYPPPLMGMQPSLLGPLPNTNWQQQNNYQGQPQGQNNTFPWNNQGQVQNQFQTRNQGPYQNNSRFQGVGQTMPGQNRFPNQSPKKKKGVCNQKQSRPLRTKEKTQEVLKDLKDIFPESEAKILEVIENHPSETDLTRLSNYVINALAK